MSPCIAIHHGGAWIRSPKLCYVGGDVCLCNNLTNDMDEAYIKRLVDKLGYKNIVKQHYLIPLKDMDSGLRFLSDSRSYITLMSLLCEFREIHIYCEHGAAEEDILNTSVHSFMELLSNDHEIVGTGLEVVVWTREDQEWTGEEFVGNKEDLLGITLDDNGSNADDEELREAMAAVQQETQREIDYEMEISSLQNLEDWKIASNSENVNEDSEYADSSDFDSAPEEEDEEGPSKKKMLRGPLYKEGTKPEDVKLSLGQQFKDSNQFKEAIRNYAIYSGRDVQFTCNKKERVAAKCKRENCPWRVWASWVGNEKTFQIKTYTGEHTCGRSDRNKKVSAQWIATNYKRFFRSLPFWRLQEIQDQVWSDRGVKVSAWMCYHARKLGHEMILGDYQEQYTLLPMYVAEIKRANADNTVKIMCENGVFQRIYICFSALRKGFKEGCRPFISFDGCFLKGPYGGQLLTAVGKDGNNHIYPIAWAVVETENAESWKWFMELLSQDLGTQAGAGYTIMSDQQKGLLNAIAHVFPQSEQRCCARHVYVNFKGVFGAGQQYKQEFWRIAKSTTINQFNERIEGMRAINNAAAEDLLKRAPKRWCRAFYTPLSVCDSVDNNLCEVFNAFILPHRHKPIVTMLDEIRESLMTRLHKMRDKIALKELYLCPRIQMKLEKAKLEARGWHAKWDGRFCYGVRFGAGQEKYVVSILDRACSCGVWQVSGIPCNHAVAAIWEQQEHPEHYTSFWFTKTQYLEAYKYNVDALNGPQNWPASSGPPIAPPKLKKRPACRPKVHRRKEVGEQGSQKKEKISKAGVQMRCTNCGEQGHNIKGCKKPVTLEALQRVKKKRRSKATKAPTQPSGAGIDLNGPPATSVQSMNITHSQPAQRGHVGCGLYTYPNGYQRVVSAPSRSKLPTIRPTQQTVKSSFRPPQQSLSVNRHGFAIYSDFEGSQSTYSYCDLSSSLDGGTMESQASSMGSFIDQRGRPVITSQALQDLARRDPNAPAN